MVISKEEQLSFALECLKLHNDIRERHSAPPLKISTELQRLAKDLTLKQYRDCVVWQDYGPNCNINSIYLLAKDKPLTPESVCLCWYNENQTHVYRVCTPKRLYARNFTQMVWVDSKEMGVAYYSNFICIAIYRPAGNIDGMYAQNVHPAIDINLEMTPPKEISAKPVEEENLKPVKSETTADTTTTADIVAVKTAARIRRLDQNQVYVRKQIQYMRRTAVLREKKQRKERWKKKIWFGGFFANCIASLCD